MTLDLDRGDDHVGVAGVPPAIDENAKAKEANLVHAGLRRIGVLSHLQMIVEVLADLQKDKGR